MNYDASSIADRAKLIADITIAEVKLEQMRIRERELRADLVNILNSLVYSAGRAKHKIETREYADGCTGISATFEIVTEKENELMDIVSDISYTEELISDMNDTLDDPACWDAA